MLRVRWMVSGVILLVALSGFLWLPAAAQKQPARSSQRSAPKATPTPKQEFLTNEDVIKLAQAKVGEEIIITKIRQSKTRFDLSTDGIVRLKTAGVSDRVLAVMMNPAGDTAATQPPKQPPAETARSLPAAAQPSAKSTPSPARSAPTPAPTPARAVITRAPANYGMYVEQNGQLLPIGRVQTKVQVSKWRSFLRNVVPLVRQKIDINLPGSRSDSRFEAVRPTFYAYFPPSRDVSKFKLLQCKITGQNFNQRTVANASIFFSTEQNQDEILCDIGPTEIKDLYRISPREDLPSGEFGFVEGNTGSKSVSNIDIIDVYDFAIDRKEDRLALGDYLNTLPAPAADTSFQSWSKDESQKIVDDHEGRVDLGGAMLGWFKRQYASLNIYWVDENFARAFARLEMLDRNLTPEQAGKLSALLQSPDQSQYFVLVSVGKKIGSGRLIGANEGERTMRPFDSLLYNAKSKDAIVTARRLEPMGGYAGLWRVTFDRASVNGQVLNLGQDVIFEGRLNQNLDFKANFKAEKISSKLAQVAP
jgi:hypothetical protein